MREKQFIVMAPNRWDRIWMNRQHLFSRVGKCFPVVYTNGPWESKHVGGDAYRAQHAFLGKRIATDNVQVVKPPKWILRNGRVPLLDKVAVGAFCNFINSQRLSAIPVVLYLFHPMFAEYRQWIKHDICVYHAYDDFSLTQGAEKFAQDEQSLVRQCDLTFASSRRIASRLESMSPRRIACLPNGVDFPLFSQESIDDPADMQSIPRPRIGYTGRINQKIDFLLLTRIAEQRRHLSFVLVGPVGSVVGNDAEALQQLKKMANVHFLGNKDPTALPGYMSAMDINIMCYKADSTTWAISGYPLKMHEYLAVGRPVISARLDAVCEFQNVVDIADSCQQWLQAIDRNLMSERSSEEAKQARRSVAANNSWDHRVDYLLDLVDQALECSLS